jgi:hypothetical protein
MPPPPVVAALRPPSPENVSRDGVMISSLRIDLHHGRTACASISWQARGGLNQARCADTEKYLGDSDISTDLPALPAGNNSPNQTTHRGGTCDPSGLPAGLSSPLQCSPATRCNLRNDSDTFDQSLQLGDRPMRRVRLCCTHQAAAPFLPALSVFDRAEC